MKSPNRMLKASLHRHAHGFTLVELLIAVTLALLIAAAVGSVFLGSSQSFRTNTGLGQVQEQGRFSSLLVVPVIRQAGFLPDPIINFTDPTAVFLPTLSKWAVHGENDLASSTSGVYAAITDIKPGTDVISVAYSGRSGTGDTPLKTCLGDNVSDTQIAVNVFYVSTADSAGSSNLHCYTNISGLGTAGTGTALSTGTTRNEPLIVGVSDMQVLYEVDTDGDGAPNRYFPANLVTDWTTVTGVQITFIVDSADVVEAGNASTAANDGVNGGRLRRTFVSTISIRNRLHN